MRPSRIETQIAIVGGGPAGLMLAIELGCRDIDCLLLDDRAADAPPFPKANATSARTMEHFRRRGFADRVRCAGLTADHPHDVVYRTRLNGHELARFRIPSREQVMQRTAWGDLGQGHWPTPELPHRVQQMVIEPILRELAAGYPSVRLLPEHRALAVRQDAAAASVTMQTSSGDTVQVHARFVVGCDGARSLVRKSMGISFQGVTREERDFLGGQMVSIYFRCDELQEVLGERAWQYWVVNNEQRGLLVAIDGIDHWVFAMQVPTGQAASDEDAVAALHNLIGVPVEVQVLGISPWLAGYTLVAERMRLGRLFIAGDAAHLFTPTSGMGYNTSIDDVVNLGWKLAASLQGWGGETLLDSYEIERRPIAQRNTEYARAMAESIGRIQVPSTLEHNSADGEAARRELGAALLAHAHKEFNTPGLQLGARYEGSPVVASEPGNSSPDNACSYEPSGRPGGRSPHVELPGGRSIFDLFGREFTLLSSASQAGLSWTQAAGALGVPLKVLPAPHPSICTLYGANLVLIRPDHHIAWRGTLHADPAQVLALATGQKSPKHALSRPPNDVSALQG